MEQTTSPSIEDIKAIFNTAPGLEIESIIEEMMDFNGEWSIVHQNHDGMGTICTVIKMDTDSLCEYRFMASEYRFNVDHNDGHYMSFENGYTTQNKGYMGERFNKPQFWGKYYNEVF
jgi:hypothetical protein